MRIKTNKAWHSLSNVYKFHGKTWAHAHMGQVSEVLIPLNTHLVSLLTWLPSVQTGRSGMIEKDGFGRPLLPSNAFDYF